MHVAITGAAGEVGRIVADAFDDDRTTLLTHSRHDDIDSTVLDASDRDAFVDALDGADVLVHLAWAPASRGEWTGEDEVNVRMAVNAFEAARENGVERVVMASSIHVFGMYNRDDPSEFESVVEDPTTTVTTDTQPRPDTYYGVAKVAVEALSTYYADRHGLEVVVVRIGWVMPRDELRGTRSELDDKHRFARAMWLDPRDCRALFRAAADHPVDRSPVFAHGISDNGDRYLTLTETMQRLDYRPEEDAAEVLDS